MSPEEFREAATLLSNLFRPTREVSPRLGKAMLLWLEDPHGLPFEAFLGMSRACDPPHPTCLRNQLCVNYAASLPLMSARNAADVILDRVNECNSGFSKPDDFGPVFVVFYKQFTALNFKLPEHRTLRRIIK